MKKMGLFSALFLGVVVQASAAVVLVGNPGITDTLTKDQAAALYLGKTTKLPSGGAVVLYDLEASDPLKAEFNSKVTGKSEAQLQSYWSRLVFTGKATPPAKLANADLVKSTVAANANAAGYMDESKVDGTVKVLFKP